MIKGVIFDFDGLLVDTESIWFEAFREALQAYGMDLTVEQFSKVIGTHDAELYEMIEKGTKKPVEREVLLQEVDDIFRMKMGEPSLRAGVVEYLEEAKESGLRIALASSSKRAWIEGFLTRLGVLHYFEVLKTKEDVEHVKPDPALYIQAYEALGLQAHECVAFEDSLNGLMAARAAGLHCVIVPNSVTAHLPFVDYSHRIESMSDYQLKHVLQLLPI
ncbi:HAD family hydrolase [Ectobacillus sp. JY-23]|nr:HAD family hydrolase [Ectobacillus sp. JY-23]UOY92728.1 HAD family hydrolase [Ectobacillus sp. JY-23]